MSGNGKGTEAAFGQRKAREMRARKLVYHATRVAGSRRTVAFPDYYEFFPEVASEREFADLSARVNCYLGDTGLPFYLPGPRFPLRPEAVPYFEPSLVRDPGWVSERPEGTGCLVVHRLTPAGVRKIVAGGQRSVVADPDLFARSELMYFILRNSTTWPTYAPVEIGMQRLRALVAGRTEASAFILATGPSALEVDLPSVDADVRITCNSAVRDIDRIREFRPSIICCTDPVFHFGPSRYAAAFRRDLVRAATEVDALVVCGHRFAGPMLGLHPELAERLVVIPHQDGGPWRWPTDRNPTVRNGANVLATLMLPLALMLADDIQIAGADGRQPTENYFWKHNPQLQYSDEMMQTVFDAHPAFFRDTDYEDYYEDFCGAVEDLCQLGERHGKRIRAAAPSWIPAMTARGAGVPAA